MGYNSDVFGMGDCLGLALPKGYRKMTACVPKFLLVCVPKKIIVS